MAGKNEAKIQFISIKDLGPLKYFLGIEWHDHIVLSQQKYTLDILEESELQGVKPSHFPMEHNLKLGIDDDGVHNDSGK